MLQTAETGRQAHCAAMQVYPDIKETTPCCMFSFLLGLLELMESVLQASDLCFLFVQHHNKTRVQLPLHRLLIQNLLLQPNEMQTQKNGFDCVEAFFLR